MKTCYEVWKQFMEGHLTLYAAGELMESARERENKEKTEKDIIQESSHIPGRYDAESGDDFWDCGNEGVKKYTNKSSYRDSYNGSSSDSRIFGMCCRTGEEAEFIYRQQIDYLALIDRIHYLNDGWEPEWTIPATLNNWYFRFDIDTQEIDIYWRDTVRIFKDELYFRTKTIGQQLIDELEAEIKLALWGIE